MFAYRESLGIVGEHLNADVIGARGVMFLDAAQHGLHITPGNHCVNKPVTSAVLDVRFLKS